MLVKNDLFDYKDRFIYQDEDYFKFSLDSILLAEFAKETKAKEIMDMCCGNMAVSLILSKYTKANIFGMEINKDVYLLGEKSLEINDLQKQIKIINDDVKNMGNYFKAEYFGAMVCNPPYFKINEKSYLNKCPEKAGARHEISLNLEDIFKIAHTYLENKGSLYLVHRAERIDELFILGNKYHLNIKKLQFISTKKGDKPKIVLIQAIKNSKMGVKVQKEICIGEYKSYQNIFKEE